MVLLSAHLHHPHFLWAELVQAFIHVPLSERNCESNDKVPQRPDRKEMELLVHKLHCSPLPHRGFAIHFILAHLF